MSVLVACDLDSTLIYSRRSAGVDVTELTCVEHRDGAPAAYMTARAATALGELAEEAVLVPVTTRTEAQLARVRLPARVDYAIAANGGRLLHNGVADDAWSREIARRLAHVASFAEASTRAERFAETHAGRPHQVAGLFTFAVLPVAEIPVDDVAAETQWAARSGWRLSVQGRKVYWVPRQLTKSAAVAEVARRCGVDVVLAAGDSLLDADLFEIATEGIHPAHGELADSGFARSNVTTTRTTGALAGEEIVEWLAGRAGSAGRGALARPAAPAAAQQ